MNIVELLLYKSKAGWYYNLDGPEAVAEIERLRQQNAELVRALDRVKTITDVHDDTDVLIALNKISKSAIAKATGGE